MWGRVVAQMRVPEARPMWREGAIVGAFGANLPADRAEKIFLGF